MGLIEKISDSQNLSQAFVRVKANQGCAGVDGVTIDEVEENLDANLNRLRNEIQSKTYFPLPLVKILVNKGNNETRALLISTVRDRIAQSAVFQVIESTFEREFETCSFAYRKGRSVKQAIYQVKEYRDKGYTWVVDADIDAYFDSIDHIRLLEKVSRLVKDPDLFQLIEAWVKSDIWDGQNVSRLQKGIPQGSVISPLLANLFLDQLDEELLDQGCKVVRFADDFVILCKSPEKAREALEITEEILARLSLELDEADIVSFDQGFKYLGVYFVRSMIFTPFDKPKRERKIIYYPPRMDLPSYLRERRHSDG